MDVNINADISITIVLIVFVMVIVTIDIFTSITVDSGQYTALATIITALLGVRELRGGTNNSSDENK